MVYNTDHTPPTKNELIALRYIQTMKRDIDLIREFQAVLTLLDTGQSLKK